MSKHNHGANKVVNFKATQYIVGPYSHSSSISGLIAFRLGCGNSGKTPSGKNIDLNNLFENLLKN